ncbi:galactose mutarotase [Prochlorococcus sp. MIT 1300]|uniref:aldose epimerase family protein n=1 Tax=Prochlorococcus sp. MIT 1300 TaxID=3096218 RepID=UPI002A75961F|nr:galactose mutarotase [Prochlorococcus sp. MIT 1300]
MALTRKSEPYPHWEYVYPDNGDRLRVVPERGGLVSEWRCNDREMLYFDRSRFLEPWQSIRGGIPILFPICGNLPGNTLPLAEGNTTLPQHGFARDLKWDLSQCDQGNGIQLLLEQNSHSLAVYPFLFTLEISFYLLKNSLEVSILLRNTGDSDMPFNFGLHPYFLVDDLSRTRIEGLSNKCFDHIRSAEDLTNNQLSNLSSGVDFLTRSSSRVTLFDDAAGTALEVHNKEPMDLTVIWTDPPRKMVCIEPWTSPRNSMISGDRKLALAPGEDVNFSCKFLQVT